MSNNQPLLPLTYHDLVCVQDLDIYGRETQSDLETLEQDVLHIMQEIQGSNLDDPDRGVGFVDALSGTSTDLLNNASLLDSQLTKDTRIDASNTTVVQNADGSWTVTVSVSVAGSVIGLVYATVAPGGLLTFQGADF